MNGRLNGRSPHKSDAVQQRTKITDIKGDVRAINSGVSQRTFVVYKIDRLSCSLMDFSNRVKIFDRNGVTFVSVTQSFNTTTSMGRLRAIRPLADNILHRIARGVQRFMIDAKEPFFVTYGQHGGHD